MQRFFLPAALAALLCASPASAAEWGHPLWLGRGGVWRARFPVTVTNPADAPLAGVPVALTVGGAPGQAPLAGARAEALRVTDAAGTQLLYGLWAPDPDRAFTTGAIPPGATLTLPAVCGPATSATYFVYYDNPRAWGLADFFDKRAFTDPNGDFERGAGDRPSGWQGAMADAQHRLAWSSDAPFSGARCLHAQTAPGAAPSWFGFMRSDFTVVPGARCTIRVRVRGENVAGSAGWYVHVGDDKISQRINQVARAGDGTFGWKEVAITFTVPDGATRLQTGSVLHGTGAAWYDAFSLETDRQPPLPTARAGATERLDLAEQGAGASWPSGSRSRDRVPVRVVNLRDEAVSNVLAVADLNSAARGIVSPGFQLTLNGAPVETCRIGDRLLFTCSTPPRTALTYYLYVSAPGAKKGRARSAAASALGSDIPSDQVLAEGPGETDAPAFANLLASPVNLVKNPSFEAPGSEPEGWTHSAADAGAAFSLASPGGFGARHARLAVSPDAK
ncbi:MAG: hypothetical protein LBW77_01150, partial [Verrucomicrobiota bacterium]|nr:hypothetical protein [Verrucomicrobiota bacterium]